jgi:hypothetical protein
MWRRYTVRLPKDDKPGSSWIQTLGFWPLNFMQNRLAHHKIAGGMQRFRAGIDIADPSIASAFANEPAPSGLASPTAVGFPELKNPLSSFATRKSDGRRALKLVG